jgi:hypothetical protein
LSIIKGKRIDYNRYGGFLEEFGGFLEEFGGVLEGFWRG